MGTDTKSKEETDTQDLQYIRDTLQEASDSFDPRRPKLTAQVQECIRDAVRSGSKELAEMACLLAFEAVKPHYRNMAAKYLYDNEGNRVDMDDMMQTLYTVIQMNIGRYDGIHALSTFFDPQVKPAFMKCRSEGEGKTLSKHYLDAEQLISKSKQKLAEQGYDNPSDQDVRRYMEHMNISTKISARTIQRVQEQKINVTSLDQMEYMPASARGELNPDVSLLKKEDREEFRIAQEKLPPLYRRVVEVELEYLNASGDESPPAGEVLRELLEEALQLDGISREDAEKLQRAAHIEFKRTMNVIKRRRETPENRMMRSSFIDRREMEEEQMAIMDALKDDISLIDF